MLIGVAKNGSRKILREASSDGKKHRIEFQKTKHGDLPDGLVAVELWSRDRQTTGIDRKLEKARIDDEARRAREAAKKEAAAKASPVPEPEPEPAKGEDVANA